MSIKNPSAPVEIERGNLLHALEGTEGSRGAVARAIWSPEWPAATIGAAAGGGACRPWPREGEGEGKEDGEVRLLTLEVMATTARHGEAERRRGGGRRRRPERRRNGTASALGDFPPQFFRQRRRRGHGGDGGERPEMEESSSNGGRRGRDEDGGVDCDPPRPIP